MKKMINKRMEEIINLCMKNGLNPFPVVFEIVTQSTMNNIIAYGLPTRARHWSHGKSYDYYKSHGEMGFSKIYEIILNNNPSYAFMMDTNTDVQNLFITAHCMAHSDFFKNNYLFQSTDRNMIHHAAEHATRIDSYIEKYGLEKVEHIMDIGFALDDHIDWHKGLYRNSYPKKKVIKTKLPIGEFDDVIYSKKKRKKYVIERTIGQKFPPYLEKDLLWFFINYAPLDDWEKDILDIIREESFYFYPQKMTKVLNEGWASYWHAEIMYQYDLSPEEHLDFCRSHERVVQPGKNAFFINPYFLGYKILKDVEKRWDEQYGKGAGKKKLFEIVATEDDISFIRNYLTPKLVEELKLFTYGYAEDYPENHEGPKYIEIKEKIRDEIVELLVKPLYNGGVPKVVVSEVGSEGTLILKHESEDMGTIEQHFSKKTLSYIWDLWTAPIELHTKNDDGKDIQICFDEAGAYIKSLDEIILEEDDEDDNLFKSSLIIP
jgi:stage V sporulation protein R